MKVSEKENKQWFDINGNLKSDFSLKQISKSWSQGTWNKFLNQTLKNQKTQNVDFEFLNSDEGKYSHLYKAIKQLTFNQQQLIKYVFWQGYSLEEVAQKLKISKGSVQGLKLRSLNKIKRLISQGAYDQHYYIERQNFKDCKQLTRDEEILEVYRMDLQGSCRF